MSSNSEERLTIEGPAGSLEMLVTRVENPIAVTVICHPNPVQGGTMTNKVVHTLMRAARDQHFCVVRFNFRGVGKSAGEHANGEGEVDDCLAVIDWALKEFELPLWVMGFSFGGYVAAAAAARMDPAPTRLLLVAPSVERLPFADLIPLACPAVVMMGEDDDVVAPSAVFELLDGQPGVEVRRFPETGHFFHGRLVELKESVESVLTLG
ncbi:alpha/beta hydrolase [Halopseudomonas pelagia]|uniref:Alpha/beta fold hydrolase n=1 Tax=Halopseudomonas pelagia TaxID=553151 RepID=A0AA91U5Q4_9GAMM|nr:alpha/beta fold hydrolase [Halopseudomonas pelagia]PCD00856.1 alpha/beta hydrolase [Halopseudomonas pelagia]QFY58146.1 alpha/beta fold hydrolase [Halopseudomonas pelagia]